MKRPEPDRRVRRTRARLRDALMALMLEKRYEKITVQEILDRADVGRATFYSHYEGKDDLLLRGVAQIAAHGPGEGGAPGSEGVALGEAGAWSFAGMFAHSRQNRRLHQIMFRRSLDNPILERVTAVVYDGIERRLKRQVEAGDEPGVPVAILARFLTGGLMAVIRWWHDQGFPYEPEEMEAFLRRAIVAP